MSSYWIFLGMMGSGKSTLGKEIAKQTKRSFQDTDRIIEMRYRMTINEIFQKFGEEHFRKEEAHVLKILQPTHGVLATGGGIVIKPENWCELQRLGTTIYLDVPPEILIERLQNSKNKRHLLQHQDWRTRFHQIYETRKALYNKADIIVQIPEIHVKTCVAYIIDLIKKNER
jgi:shikimate kinase